MCLSYRGSHQDSRPQVKLIFPNPKGAFFQPMELSSGGTWTRQNPFCGWLHARNYDSRERSIFIRRRRKGG